MAFFIADEATAQINYAVTSITQPTSAPTVYSGYTNITFQIQNRGSTGINLFSIITQVRIDGGSWSPSDNFCSGFINPGQSANCTIPSSAELSDFFVTGAHTLELRLSGPPDIDPGDNVLSMQYFSAALPSSTNEISSFPYVEDFESGAGGWIPFAWDANSSRTFNLGAIFGKETVSGAGSGAASWYLNSGSGNYGAGTRSQVISPIFDFRSIPVVNLSLYVAWESPALSDGAVIQYSTDGGIVWNNVGVQGEPDNWYNAANPTGLVQAGVTSAAWAGYISSGTPFFGASTYYTSGTGAPGYLTSGSLIGSDGWVVAKHAIPGGAKTKLRVLFSGPAGGDDGFLFDAVTLSQGLAGSQTDSLVSDLDSDGRADPGDTIRHTVVILNPSGLPVTNLVLDEGISDTNLSLVAGTVTTSQGTVNTGNGGSDTTVQVALGSLANGAQATVTFDVVVGSLNSNVTSVCLQGAVTATEFGSINALTDDPDTATGLDTTCTAAFLDSDNDGVSDTSDICPGFNDAQDADQDTVPDGCDVCPVADDRIDVSPANGTPDCSEPSTSVGPDGSCLSAASDCAVQPLLQSLCLGANGFHSQVNIVTIQNKLGSPLPISVRYFDQGGVQRGVVSTAITANTKQDFVVNDMGLQKDTIGSVCVSAGSGVGAWTGGLAVYKPNLRGAVAGGVSASSEGAYDYALYYPFTNPFESRSSVTLNTYHLGVDPAAIVANYIGIADAIRGDGKPLTGLLHIYDRNGVEVGTGTPLNIPDGGRQDVDAHRLLTSGTNVDALGTATFVPDPLQGGGTAKYYLTSTRYFYDCQTLGCSDFLTAFVLPSRPTTDANVAGDASTKDGEIAILEIANFESFASTVAGAPRQEGGAVLPGFEQEIAPHGTRHFIMNDGYVPADTAAGGLFLFSSGKGVVYSINYKLDPNTGKLVYAYASPYYGGSVSSLTSGFNSYLSHSNQTQIFAATGVQESLNVNFTDFTGASVSNNSNVNLPALGSVRLSPTLPANSYGSVKITGAGPNFSARTVIGRPGEYKMCVPAF